MKPLLILKTICSFVATLVIICFVNAIVIAQDITITDSYSESSIIIKGSVVRAEDVCGIVAEANIYIIPCEQVDGFEEKLVNVIGVIIEDGDLPTIDATSVQTIE